MVLLIACCMMSLTEAEEDVYSTACDVPCVCVWRICFTSSIEHIGLLTVVSFSFRKYTTDTVLMVP